ncbi:hypothetical protein QTP88_026043 [Uroleucon formosanum]
MATRLSIYKIYIKPILLYAITEWEIMLSKTNWRQMEAVQNIALRVITVPFARTSIIDDRRPEDQHRSTPILQCKSDEDGDPIHITEETSDERLIQQTTVISKPEAASLVTAKFGDQRR